MANSNEKPEMSAKAWRVQIVVRSLVLGIVLFLGVFAGFLNPVREGTIVLNLLFSPFLTYAVFLLLAVLLAAFPRRFRQKGFCLNLLLIAFGTALWAVVCVLIGFAVQKISDAALDRRIAYYTDNAETIIAVEPSVYHMGGIRKTGIENPCMLVDYDTHSVAFLLSEYNFKEYHLTQDGGTPPGAVQCEIPLTAPAQSLISYYPGDESNVHRTTGLELVMADGTRYSCAVTSDRFDSDALSLDARTEGSWYAENRLK